MDSPRMYRKELDAEVAVLYRKSRARSGVTIPQLEPLLARQDYDPEPARALLAKHETVDYPYRCRFGRANLEIDEGVFCPTFTNASPFLLSEIEAKQGDYVLDAFAGSGAFGVHTALRGASVVSYDASERAVNCIRKNAILNNVEETMDVRMGTLGQIIAPSEQFDVVIANPPLIPVEATDTRDAALFDTGLQATVELIDALPTLLKRNGRCYLLTSDVIDRDEYRCDIDELCRQRGLKMSTTAQLHKKYESYRVHKIEKRRLPSFLFKIR